MAGEIWAVRWTRPLTGEEAAALTVLLPSDRRARLERQRPEKQQEALCAYGLLLLALRRRGWRAFPEMAADAQGKPRFLNGCGLEFSVSHTDGAALAALSEGPIGVDIERHRPVRPEAMRRIAGTEDPDAFFRCWVRREARGKCSGRGVGTMLRTETPLEAGEFYQELDVFPGYAAGAAYRTHGALELTRLGLEDLMGDLL